MREKAAGASVSEPASARQNFDDAAAERTGIEPGRVVAYDAYRGSIWSHAADRLEEFGMTLRNMEGAIDDHRLRDVDILILSGITHTSTTTGLSAAEVDAIERFVGEGGSLLCSGQVWSWTYSSYGNHPADTHPYNQIGKRLGFEITGMNVGAPTYFSTAMMSGVTNIVRTHWWPSKIQFASPVAHPIIRDERLYPIAGDLTYGRGRVVVVGHDGMLEENPDLARRVLSYLAAPHAD